MTPRCGVAPHVDHPTDALGFEKPQEFREVPRGVSDRIDHISKLLAGQSGADIRERSHGLPCDAGRGPPGGGGMLRIASCSGVLLVLLSHPALAQRPTDSA